MDKKCTSGDHVPLAALRERERGWELEALKQSYRFYLTFSIATMLTAVLTWGYFKYVMVCN